MALYFPDGKWKAVITVKQRRSRVALHERAAEAGELAAVVLARREQLGLRQDELADLAGCSPRFVNELERGKATAQLDKVVDVLAALGLHLAVGDGALPAVTVGAELRAEHGLDRVQDS